MKTYIWQQRSWPAFTWDTNKVLEHLALARKTQGKILEKATHVGVETEAHILVEDAHKTSAIEGEHLDLESLRSSVARRLGLSTAGVSTEQRYIEGLVQMLMDAGQNFSKPLTQDRLMGWQAGLFPTGYSGIHKIPVGQWRKNPEPMRVVSGRVGKEKVHFEAPPSKLVSKEMGDFLKWFNSKNKMDGILRAAVAHLWFVTIHPFEDGNGRIARAITDMALAQDEGLPRRYYSLSSQISIDRKDYYNNLENTQKGDLNITEWIIWFLQMYVRAVKHSEVIINRAVAIGNFWKSHSHLAFNLRQRKVLKKLLEAEPEGFVGGMTNRKYVNLTKTSRETAKRDLADLEEKGVIKRNESKGRSVSYALRRKV